ncbi:MAG: hypothetical protein IT168_12930 [Bryobacterales bacterium]|nr:hypothetical protein [Bryobacterales bacterium]
MRFLLPAALAVGAYWSLTHPPLTALSPEDALRSAPSHAHYWAGLAEAYASRHDIPKARLAFDHALRRSLDVPQIYLRYANFLFSQNEPEAALVPAARVLRRIPDYDDILFSYFDRFEVPPARVLSHIGRHKRSSQGYFTYLLAANLPTDARLVWDHLTASHFASDQLASTYVDTLLRTKDYQTATAIWSNWLGSARRADYPTPNILFNGSFDQPFTGCALDWRVTPLASVQVTRDSTHTHHGSASLRLTFPGTENLSYAHVTQAVPVSPGLYSLTAWVRSEGLTTDEGPRLEVIDAANPSRLSVASPPITGTRTWSPLTLNLSIPSATRLIQARIVRYPSVRFDSKIAGTLWIDRLVLHRLGTRSGM